MSNFKPSKEVIVKRKEDLPVELESQFILRLPEGPSQELRKALKSGATNVKDRLSIQLENDVRHGTVRLDNFVWAAKLVDLPCVLETHKTIDRKTFYKTADVCQMLICKDDEDSQTTEEEDNTKKKDKKELLKVEKKYQWPHGITPPLKNVRKRRFRKTLKKKYVDAPEIEKEVKRLFRVDNEAVFVKWEVIMEDEDGTKPTKTLMGESLNNVGSPAISGPLFSNSQSLDIAEHDIFGGVVSSSEDEVNIEVDTEDEASIESDSKPVGDDDLVFSKKLLQGGGAPSTSSSTPTTLAGGGGSGGATSGEFFGQVADWTAGMEVPEHVAVAKKELTSEQILERREDLLEKLGDLRRQLLELRGRIQAQQLDLASIDNQALKQRLQPVLDRLIEEEKEKQSEYEEISSLLKNCDNSNWII